MGNTHEKSTVQPTDPRALCRQPSVFPIADLLVLISSSPMNANTNINFLFFANYPSAGRVSISNGGGEEKEARSRSC